ncbi:MAG TPA: PIN domain-containing protein [Firmicutes bacterium]|nr:PIN domain-containing protein [Bacillota bacterium]
MQEELFVDTSAWVALADRGEARHTAATEAYPELLSRYRLVTTNLVVAETYILLRRNLGVEASLQFLTAIEASPRIELVRSSEELEREALKLLRKYKDQSFSFADAVSFALMGKRRIARSFTFDNHFSIAGFEVIP